MSSCNLVDLAKDVAGSETGTTGPLQRFIFAFAKALCACAEFKEQQRAVRAGPGPGPGGPGIAVPTIHIDCANLRALLRAAMNDTGRGPLYQALEGMLDVMCACTNITPRVINPLVPTPIVVIGVIDCGKAHDLASLAVNDPLTGSVMRTFLFAAAEAICVCCQPTIIGPGPGPGPRS